MDGGDKALMEGSAEKPPGICSHQGMALAPYTGGRQSMGNPGGAFGWLAPSPRLHLHHVATEIPHAGTCRRGHGPRGVMRNCIMSLTILTEWVCTRFSDCSDYFLPLLLVSTYSVISPA